MRQLVQAGQADVGRAGLQPRDHAAADARGIGQRRLAQSAVKPKSIFALSRQEFALVLVTMLWGSTFLIIHIAMQHSGPLFFVGVRFTIAGLVTMLLFRKHMMGITRFEIGAGIAIGCALFLGYYLQTHGLRTITSSQSAFITALYVPIVPLLQWAVLKRPPGLMSWIGVALAFTGLILLAGPEAGSLNFSPGEVATLAGAVAIAAEIILIGMFAKRVDSRRVTAVQLLTAGLVSVALMPVLGEGVPEFSWLNQYRPPAPRSSTRASRSGAASSGAWRATGCRRWRWRAPR
ncbi:hypothetical protein G6F65_017270 [Rhizopus arrhizus]|nr:hypothetical protein G6F65_017270 [Rhizopus arrhizus]